MPTAPVQGINLYYQTTGEGPAVVLAHGRGGNHMSWWQQVPVFSERYSCITFDHRGWGRSLQPPEAMGREAFVEDLRGLLDHLGIEEAFLIAQSMGGLTCLGFALADPRRTRALVLAGTTGGSVKRRLSRSSVSASPPTTCWTGRWPPASGIESPKRPSFTRKST